MLVRSLLAMMLMLALGAVATVVETSGCCTCGTVDPHCSPSTPSAASVCVKCAADCNAELCQQILPHVEDAPFSFGVSGCTPLGVAGHVVTNLGICPVGCLINSTLSTPVCAAEPNASACINDGGVVSTCDWAAPAPRPNSTHTPIPWLFIILTAIAVFVAFVVVICVLRFRGARAFGDMPPTGYKRVNA